METPKVVRNTGNTGNTGGTPSEAAYSADYKNLPKKNGSGKKTTGKAPGGRK